MGQFTNSIDTFGGLLPVEYYMRTKVEHKGFWVTGVDCFFTHGCAVRVSISFHCKDELQTVCEKYNFNTFYTN